VSKLRTKRPQKRAPGAFTFSLDDPPNDDLFAERDAFRAFLIGIVSAHWSYSEIREFGEAQQRDRERAREIAELFAEAQGASTLESACYIVHHERLGHASEVRKLDHAGRAGKYRRFRARFRSDPEFRERCIAQARRRYRRWLARHPRPKQAKLSAAKAVSLRHLYQTGLMQTDLAELSGVSLSAISLLVKGKTWKDAGGPIVSRAPRTHRLRPFVKCAEKVEARLDQMRAYKAKMLARDPDYYRRAERERRERDPEAQRAKDRETYLRKAEKMKEKYREKIAKRDAGGAPRDREPVLRRAPRSGLG
jgi:hypothetical protein